MGLAPWIFWKATSAWREAPSQTPSTGPVQKPRSASQLLGLADLGLGERGLAAAAGNAEERRRAAEDGDGTTASGQLHGNPLAP